MAMINFALVACLLLPVLFFWCLRARFRPPAVAGIPVVRSFLPWIGSGLSFIGNPKAFLNDARKKVSLCTKQVFRCSLCVRVTYQDVKGRGPRKMSFSMGESAGFSFSMFLLPLCNLIVTIICGYYILRIFAIWKKNPKIKSPQNFYQTIRHSGVHANTITNCVMFSTLEHA